MAHRRYIILQNYNKKNNHHVRYIIKSYNTKIDKKDVKIINDDTNIHNKSKRKTNFRLPSIINIEGNLDKIRSCIAENAINASMRFRFSPNITKKKISSENNQNKHAVKYIFSRHDDTNLNTNSLNKFNRSNNPSRYFINAKSFKLSSNNRNSLKNKKRLSCFQSKKAIYSYNVRPNINNKQYSDDDIKRMATRHHYKIVPKQHFSPLNNLDISLSRVTTKNASRINIQSQHYIFIPLTPTTKGLKPKSPKSNSPKSQFSDSSCKFSRQFSPILKPSKYQFSPILKPSKYQFTPILNQPKYQVSSALKPTKYQITPAINSRYQLTQDQAFKTPNLLTHTDNSHNNSCSHIKVNTDGYTRMTSDEKFFKRTKSLQKEKKTSKFTFFNINTHIDKNHLPHISPVKSTYVKQRKIEHKIKRFIITKSQKQISQSQSKSVTDRTELPIHNLDKEGMSQLELYRYHWLSLDEDQHNSLSQNNISFNFATGQYFYIDSGQVINHMDIINNDFISRENLSTNDTHCISAMAASKSIDTLNNTLTCESLCGFQLERPDDVDTFYNELSFYYQTLATPTTTSVITPTIRHLDENKNNSYISDNFIHDLLTPNIADIDKNVFVNNKTTITPLFQSILKTPDINQYIPPNLCPLSTPETLQIYANEQEREKQTIDEISDKIVTVNETPQKQKKTTYNYNSSNKNNNIQYSPNSHTLTQQITNISTDQFHHDISPKQLQNIPDRSLFQMSYQSSIASTCSSNTCDNISLSSSSSYIFPQSSPQISHSQEEKIKKNIDYQLVVSHEGNEELAQSLDVMFNNEEKNNFSLSNNLSNIDTLTRSMKPTQIMIVLDSFFNDFSLDEILLNQSNENNTTNSTDVQYISSSYISLIKNATYDNFTFPKC